MNERLAKLLGMLGSDYDGERANAAAMISRMAKAEKKSIVDFIMNGSVVFRDRVVYQDRVVYRDRVVEKIVYRDRPAPKPNLDDLVSSLRSSRSRPQADPDGDLIQQLAWAADFPEYMTAYEIDFIDSILMKYRGEAGLSYKQSRVAQRIIMKAKAMQGDPLI